MELFWGKAAFCRLKEVMCFKNAGLVGGATEALQGVLPVFYLHSSILGILKAFFKAVVNLK